MRIIQLTLCNKCCSTGIIQARKLKDALKDEGYNVSLNIIHHAANKYPYLDKTHNYIIINDLQIIDLLQLNIKDVVNSLEPSYISNKEKL